jgi:hypothetical protein
MSSFLKSLDSVCTHREIVPIYFIRARSQFILTGIHDSHGAVLVDQAGKLLQAYPSKRAALTALGCN